MVVGTDNAVASGSMPMRTRIYPISRTGPLELGIPIDRENSNHLIDNSSAHQIRNGAFRGEPRFNHTNPNNGPNREFDQLVRGQGGGDGDGDGNGGDGFQDTEMDESEQELHYTILVDLSHIEHQSDRLWVLLDQARIEVVERLRLGTFDDTIEDDSYTHQVLRFDGFIPNDAVLLVDETDEMELVHRSLEQWLMTMLDIVSQGMVVSLPWIAGAWQMNWLG